MDEDRGINEARARALEAARWLRLIGFRAHAAAPAFGPRTATYHDMLNPDADPGRLASACRCMRPLVERQLAIEQIEANRIWSRRDALDDPYRLERRATLRGAVLADVLRLLAAAVAAYEESVPSQRQ
jgi:hypothetical protein